MPEISLGLFVCFAVPLLVALVFTRGQARQSILFIILGMVICLFCGELNVFISSNASMAIENYAIFISPVIEEIFKAIPLFIYVFAFNPKKENIVQSALLLGIGFSMHENAYVLTFYGESVSLLTSIFRAFGAGMMHIVTVLYVGYVLTIVQEKKLVILYMGVTLLIAIGYHALFNFIGFSSVPFIGTFIPFISFIPLVIYLIKIKYLPRHGKDNIHE